MRKVRKTKRTREEEKILRLKDSKVKWTVKMLTVKTRRLTRTKRR